MILYTSEFKQVILKLYARGFSRVTGGKKYDYPTFINIRIRKMRTGLNDLNDQVNTLQNT